jgi:hypothetical protein
MEENISYHQNITGENPGGSELFDPLLVSDFFAEGSEDSWILGAPGKPGDVGGKLPEDTEVILSDALPFMLLLVVAYVFVMKNVGRLQKIRKVIRGA